MSTWHQDRARQEGRGPSLQEDVLWRVISDPPGGMMTSMVFTRKSRAEEYLINLRKHGNGEHSYIIPPDYTVDTIIDRLEKTSRLGDLWYDTYGPEEARLAKDIKEARKVMRLAAEILSREDKDDRELALINQGTILEGAAESVRQDWSVALEMEAEQGRSAKAADLVWDCVIRDLTALNRLFMHMQIKEAGEGLALLYDIAVEHRERAARVSAGDS